MFLIHFFNFQGPVSVEQVISSTPANERTNEYACQSCVKFAGKPYFWRVRGVLFRKELFRSAFFYSCLSKDRKNGAQGNHFVSVSRNNSSVAGLVLECDVRAFLAHGDEAELSKQVNDVSIVKISELRHASELRR